MTIVIVDNGKGASAIAGDIRSSKIIKPSEISKIRDAGAWILSDGKPSKETEKCFEVLKKTDKPVLALGLGYLYLASAFGADIVEAKPKKEVMIRIVRNCPLTTDFKKAFRAVKQCPYAIRNLPEGFDVSAKSDYEFEIISDIENPFFGVHFNPELSPETVGILRNFEKFVTEVWEKYHK
ncbi:MAG: hypothetical protein HZB66_03055 [Candidatus Aenigmarchaeota archaeon]|nr:hypothetical protein [Candidatus Aenigmarchaeota archaeon]